MKTPFKKAVQAKFEQVKLRDEQINNLLSLQENDENMRSTLAANSSKMIKVKYLALTAMVLVAISLVFNLSNTSVSMADAIAAEVTHNHFKLKPLEVETKTLDEIGAHFTKLDFKPIPSRLVAQENWTLIGARYCSLQGITAAQIRYKTQQGEIKTFYEVIYDPSIYANIPDIEKGEEPLVSFSKGVGVKVWVEKGILMAMTY